jgi:hypothetical protein
MAAFSDGQGPNNLQPLYEFFGGVVFEATVIVLNSRSPS